MIQGTSSSAGKSVLAAALCRIFSDYGVNVAPFKSQNMSNFSYEDPLGHFEIARAQAIQAIAARCDVTPDLNPIMLKPTGNHHSVVYLCGKRYKKMHIQNYYQNFVKTRGAHIAVDSLRKLQKNYDLVILEGAGSPAEINIQKYDITNMYIADKAKTSAVLLVSDINRGGSFASLAGTVALLQKRHQKLVQGFIFNKFRGDVNILTPGFEKLKRLTKIPTLGVVPLIQNLRLPDEDSLDAGSLHRKNTKFRWTTKNVGIINKELDKLAKTVAKNLDIDAIRDMIQ